MANVIKSATTISNGTIKRNNFLIGIDSSTVFGPTSSTNFWAGVVPPSSGYTVYEQKSQQGPSIRVAQNNSELITIAKQYGGTNITTIYDALNYFNGQSNYLVTNIDYPNIVTSGLTLLYDAGYIPSYPTTGTTCNDLSTTSAAGTLVSGVTYNTSGGGSFGFNGINGYISTTTSLANTAFTIMCWIYPNVTPANNTFFSVGTAPQNRQAIHLRMVSNTSFLFGMYNDDLSATVTGVTGTWNCFAVTLTSGFVQSVYQNGIFNTSRTALGYYVGTTTCNIGRFGLSTGEYVNGNIPIVQVYNRALSASEVLQNYNALRSRFGI